MSCDSQSWVGVQIFWTEFRANVIFSTIKYYFATQLPKENAPSFIRTQINPPGEGIVKNCRERIDSPHSLVSLILVSCDNIAGDQVRNSPSRAEKVIGFTGQFGLKRMLSDTRFLVWTK
jgi:hypothetical protein